MDPEIKDQPPEPAKPADGQAPAKPGGTPPKETPAAAQDLLPRQLELALAQTFGGREVVTVALVVLLGAFALSVIAFRDGAGVAAAMGSVTTLIGTLVGTYFGFREGSRGQEKATAAAAAASQTAVTAAAYVAPEQVGPFLARVKEINSTINGNPNASDF